MFLAAYVGSSMNPTLREPEIMEIIPYDSRPLRVGDVAFFMPPDTDQPVVHRIIRMTPEGISTLGDNNTLEDAFLLQPQSIKGRVVAASRGQKRRKIAGGLQGRLIHRWLRLQRVVYRGALPLLHPLYKALSNTGLIVRLLPSLFRPRVVVFRLEGRDQLQLLLRQRVIGRYDDQRHQWRIQRPFHLLVDRKEFPWQEEIRQVNRKGSMQRQRTLDNLQAQGAVHHLDLADGTHWEILAGDEEAASILSELGCAMQLRMTTGVADSSYPGCRRRLLVQVAAHSSLLVFYIPLASKDDGDVVCILNPRDNWGGSYVNLLRLSLVFARQAQANGGILIHGALAERDGIGVILTGAGGTGKSTASRRFPPPWRSLCDDTTLVVRDTKGNYWAHPWPTWSCFLDGGAGGTWDVQKPLPLAGIFILAQAVEDSVERIGLGKAISLLVECVGQVSTFITPSLFKEELRAMHMERFNNLCTLAGVTPVHLLHISLTGAFWQEIEQVLGSCRGEETRESIRRNESESRLQNAV